MRGFSPAASSSVLRLPGLGPPTRNPLPRRADASLDPAATRAVEQIIDLFHQSGTKIVMTTHDLGQARRLADEVIFLHQGRVAGRAAAADFFDRPANAAARAFLDGNLLCEAPPSATGLLEFGSPAGHVLARGD